MEEPKITSGTVPYNASEIPDDPRDNYMSNTERVA